MTELKLAAKGCVSCSEVKPLTEFYRLKSSPDGRARRCATCERRRVSEYAARQRALYPKGFRAKQRAAVARHREKHGLDRNKQIDAAWHAAARALIAAHPKQFAALYKREKYDRGILKTERAS